MLKTFQDYFSLSRIISAYVWSNVVSFPDGERFQANIDSFIRCITMPEAPIGNILILQGGILHMEKASYYIRVASALLPKTFRVFIFEKLLPVVDPKFAHDVADCINLIKEKFPGPLCIIGYSMGSILLNTYFSFGYDQADFYICVCGPLNLKRFRETVNSNCIFKDLEKRACKAYQVENYEGLLKIAGTSLEENLEFEKNFIKNLNYYKKNWVHKTIYIISEDDPLTSIEDLNLLDHKPITYFIKGGWHCCLESILLSTKIANEVLISFGRNVD